MAKTHPKTGFSEQRNILNFRPKINFIEPAQIPDIPPAAIEAPVTLEVLKVGLDSAIDEYKNIAQLADAAQLRIDERSKGLIINLDLSQDAIIINAVQRHFNDTSKTTISYDDYKNCIESIRKDSLSRVFTTSPQDVLAANNDPFRTSFGGIGKAPGMARPELYNKIQAIKPLDLAKFTEEQLLKLGIELLELFINGPVGILAKPLKAIVDYLRGQLRSKRTKNNLAVDQVLSGLDDASTKLATEPDSYIGKEQDCNLIVDAYERGAHFSDTESSVYAPLSRNVQNTKSLSEGMQQILSGYKANQISTPVTQGIHDEKQSIKFGPVEITLPNNQATQLLNKAIRECIPCSFRIGTFMELNIGSQLLDLIKADIKRRYAALQALADLFNNVDIYGDFCQMVGFLNFMCVPDLQRILAMLAAMLMDFGINLSGIMNLILQLVAPFMTPILMSVNALLDRFIQLVLQPIDCIINAIDLQVRKLMIQPNVNLGLGKPNFTKTSLKVSTGIAGAEQHIAELEAEAKSGLVQLGSKLDQAQRLIRNKLSFLTKEAEKLLSSHHGKDLGYTAMSRDKLVVIRLVGLVKAMISAVSSGKKLCADQAKPSITEIDNFYQHYVSPSSPFKISVDGDGNLVIAEKEAGQLAQRPKALVLNNITFNPVSAIFKCPIASTEDDASRVNDWILELDKI